jgi:diaminohydroxyphosphoribosylaminopyrimidine deaminase/5-amino-6-(5-phosphoribosylamino)uracil reductase
MAVDLAGRCPPSTRALSVGAVIVVSDELLATGYSRETGPHDHAEEVALARLSDHDSRLPEATLYSSVEPCGARRSRPCSCAELIVAAGIRRVVFALPEPPVLVDQPCGAERLRSAGVTVIELPQLADQAKASNAHLLG